MEREASPTACVQHGERVAPEPAILKSGLPGQIIYTIHAEKHPPSLDLGVIAASVKQFTLPRQG
jgi:hypothetical protein